MKPHHWPAICYSYQFCLVLFWKSYSQESLSRIKLEKLVFFLNPETQRNNKNVCFSYTAASQKLNISKNNDQSLWFTEKKLCMRSVGCNSLSFLSCLVINWSLHQLLASISLIISGNNTPAKLLLTHNMLFYPCCITIKETIVEFKGSVQQQIVTWKQIMTQLPLWRA